MLAQSDLSSNLLMQILFLLTVQLQCQQTGKFSQGLSHPGFPSCDNTLLEAESPFTIRFYCILDSYLVVQAKPTHNNA
jgi:hypothetical protein